MTRSRSYIEASRRLMEYAAINRADTEFARSGEIVYIFDTSVLEAYWRRDPIGISGRYGIDPLLTANAARYSGWLALKFLIEHRLPGLAGTGYISAAHWNEALDRVGKFETEIRQGLKNEPLHLGTVDQALRELLALEKKPSELLQEAKKRKLDGVFTKVMTAVSSADRIKRIFINGRESAPSIRDLSFCAQYSGAGDQPIRHEDFRRWLGRISHHRATAEAGRQAKSRAAQRVAASRNNENDALTLATIQAMYRPNMRAEYLEKARTSDQAATSASERRRSRFVFVTPDAALHAAFHDIAPRLADEGIPRFIRHPHVYNPLLNHANMSREFPTGDRANPLKSVFVGVEHALDALFPFPESDGSMAKWTRDLDLNRNIEVWSTSVETLCLSNSHYVLSDLGGDYVTAGSIAKLLSSPDVREAAARSVRSDIEHIRDDHIQKMSVVALEALSGVLTREPGGQAVGPHYRAPVKLIDVDILDALGLHTERRSVSQIAWLEALLASFRTKKSPEALKQVIQRMESAWNEPRKHAAAQLLAACIYFAMGAWESARTCAELCRERIERSRARQSGARKWLREARYCEALALRMQLRSQEDVTCARDLLTQNLADGSHRLSYLRDKVERATLILTATITQTLEDDLQHEAHDAPFIDLVERDKVSTAFEDALEDLRDVLEEIENFEVDASREMATRIRIQAEINLLGALIFQSYLGARLTAEPVVERSIGMALQALEQTLIESRLTPSKTAQIYLAIGAYLATSDQRRGEHALELLNSPAISDAEFSRADRAEVDFFIRRLKANLGGAPN